MAKSRLAYHRRRAPNPGAANDGEKPLTRARIIIAGIATLVLGAGIAVAEPGAPDRAGMDQHWRQHACTERYARLSARLAYLEVELDLTAEQRPLWDTWRAAVADGAGKVRTVCVGNVPAPDAKPTIVDRLAHLQERLATEAAAIQAAQPSLVALYQSLTPDQRDTVEHVLKMGHRHPGGWHHHGFGPGRPGMGRGPGDDDRGGHRPAGDDDGGHGVDRN